ncbi:hypothetical protein JL09_g6720, partial [Pichia kudriavzevii]
KRNLNYCKLKINSGGSPGEKKKKNKKS